MEKSSKKASGIMIELIGISGIKKRYDYAKPNND
jgi:hypothetical protein